MREIMLYQRVLVNQKILHSQEIAMVGDSLQLGMKISSGLNTLRRQTEHFVSFVARSIAR
jgi:hypothetical protein